MPRDLFGDVTRPSISIGNRKWYTVPVSLFSHSVDRRDVLIALPILAPAVHAVGVRGRRPDLDHQRSPPTPPPPPRRSRLEHRRTPPSNPDAAPTEAPTGITTEPELADSRMATIPRSYRRSSAATSTRQRRPRAAAGGRRPRRQQPVRVGGDDSRAAEDCATSIRSTRRSRRRRASGHRHHRSDDRRRRPGDQRAHSALGAAARSGGARRGAAVAIHADDAERRAGAGDHDGHGQLHVVEVSAMIKPTRASSVRPR